MAKYSENPILSSDVNWNEPDPQNGLKWSGKSIREFQQRKNKETEHNTATKFGAEYYVPGTLIKYNFANEEDKAKWLESGDSSLILSISEPNFTGKQHQLKITSEQPQNIFFIATSNKAEITVGFVSQEKDVTASSWTDVYEDAFFTVLVDKGNAGEWQTIVENKRVQNGNTLTVDVRKYLANGANRVRFIARGETSEETASFIFTANVTSMYLAPSNFNWAKPFIEGQAYSLGGVLIGGTLQKKLFIRVTGTDYEREYELPIGTQTYETSAYFFKGLEHPLTTGVYHVEMWLDATTVESDHLHYDIMCVASSDIATAQLVVVNEIPNEVLNYSDGEIFKYACYNGGTATASPYVIVTADDVIFAEGLLTDVATAVAHGYSASIEIDSDAANLSLTAEIRFGNTISADIPVDNSASYPATPNPIFYLQPSSRSNAQSNKEQIINAITGVEVPTSVERITWTDGVDGWTTDEEGRKCLLIPAGSKVTAGYKPFASIGTGKTIEFVYKVRTSTEDDAVITVCDNPASATFRGLKVLPEQIILHSRDLNVSDLSQSYFVETEALIDLVVSIAPNYKESYGNIAFIFVNGRKVCEFGYDNTDSFVSQAPIILGSATSDLYIYTAKVYDRAFDSPSALRNQEASLRTREQKAQARLENTVDLGENGKMSYAAVKDRVNTFTVKMRDNADLPSYGKSKDYYAYCDLTINLIQKAWKIILKALRIEGQGTTSMNYWLWNLRFRIDKSGNVIIMYLDGSEVTVGNVWFDGVGVHPLVERMTFKKNYASSMQAHKMGSCRMYNDIYFHLAEKYPDWELLNEAKALMAVYQYPALGFELRDSEDSTEPVDYFMGLFTIGPDKNDPKTFGYDKYKSSLLRLEGLDHNFKGVGYDYPWERMKYIASEESICYFKGGVWQKAWEVGAAGTAKTQEEVQAYLDEEYAPAYKLPYHCSTLIMGTTATLSEMNANPSVWMKQTDNTGRPFEHYEFWRDGEYDVIYFDEEYQEYRANGINLLTQLGIAAEELEGLTLEQKNERFKAARRAMFRTEAHNYFNVRGNILCMQHGLILAASDNLKKNTYVEKFMKFIDGGRYRQKRDDDDSIFRNDNQSYPSKSYSVEQNDFTDDTKTAYVFKGEDSRFFRLLQESFPEECQECGHEILTAMSDNAKGDDAIQRVLQYIDDQFFAQAQEYFSRPAYNFDTEIAYEDAYPHYVSGRYDVDTNPLSQAHGASVESERAWAKLRMIYMASKFRFGPFEDYRQTSLGRITFRTQLAVDLTVTPAIDLYPCVLSGQGGGAYAPRTRKGESVILRNVGGSNTNVYIMAADYLEDIGDLCKLSIDASTDATLGVASQRLKRLKVGDEIASEVTSNLQTLNITNAPALLSLDARNLASFTGSVNLTSCSRIIEALFGGTDVRGITLRNGAKIEHLQLSDVVTSLSLRNLGFLTTERLEYSTLANVEYLRIENNKYLDGFAMLKEAYYAENSALKNIRVIGFDYSGDANDLDMLATLGNGDYTGIDADGNVTESLPVIEGVLRISTPVYEDSLKAVEQQYPALKIVTAGDYYIRFEDDEVRAICATKWGDGIGLKYTEAAKITSLGTTFNGNTTITSFDELKEFGVTAIAESCFRGCTNLNKIDLSKITVLNGNSFYGCTSLNGVILSPSLTSISYYAFYNCSALANVTLPTSLTTIGNSAFNGCSSLTNINLPSSLTTIGSSAFESCSSLIIEDLALPNLTSFGNLAFRNVTVKKVSNLGKITNLSVQNLTFGNKKTLEEFHIPSSVTSCDKASMFEGYTNTKFYADWKKITVYNDLTFFDCRALEIQATDLVNVTKYGDSTFRNCHIIGELSMPNLTNKSLKFNGYNSIAGGLTKVLNLGTTVTTLAPGCFFKNPKLTLIKVPSQVIKIETEAFAQCSSLVTFICNAVTPPSIATNSFSNTPIASKTGTIYVPDESVEAYKTATNWVNYASIIKPLSEYVES